ncbi:uncharacterized protein I303_108311 [Kwoniella dejecticola CBS 10117]|uniref:F-box domain-containing protein n=1 Tax=Kwoniella dejecticola CBS 10117 TaxID=1296121 RepID=A0A1A5ZXS0_9TREE|nr:uncharacterized protein I303_07362 [Kwoniella dejecticola CBS 10117]OBR82600.1 hypothetical protein I303_07362 [Kwoniella dejecticola CBS 10117]
MEDIYPCIVAQVDDTYTLRQLALVNKDINQFAITRLYNTVRLSTTKQVLRFCLQAPGWVTSKVRHLELRISMEGLGSMYLPIDMLIGNLRMLNTVATLDIVMENDEPFDGTHSKNTLMLNYMFQFLLGYLFDPTFAGPMHLRARYTVLGRSSQCPFEFLEHIMYKLKHWTAVQTLDLPVIGPFRSTAAPASSRWNVNAANSIKTISLSRSFFRICDRHRMGEWLEEIAKSRTKIGNLDTSEDKSNDDYRKIRLEIRGPVDDSTKECFDNFRRAKDPNGVYDFVIVSEGRETEHVEIWRKRILNGRE